MSYSYKITKYICLGVHRPPSVDLNTRYRETQSFFEITILHLKTSSLLKTNISPPSFSTISYDSSEISTINYNVALNLINWQQFSHNYFLTAIAAKISKLRIHCSLLGKASLSLLGASTALISECAPYLTARARRYFLPYLQVKYPKL